MKFNPNDLKLQLELFSVLHQSGIKKPSNYLSLITHFKNNILDWSHNDLATAYELNIDLILLETMTKLFLLDDHIAPNAIWNLSSVYILLEVELLKANHSLRPRNQIIDLNTIDSIAISSIQDAWEAKSSPNLPSSALFSARLDTYHKPDTKTINNLSLDASISKSFGAKHDLLPLFSESHQLDNGYVIETRSLRFTNNIRAFFQLIYCPRYYKIKNYQHLFIDILRICQLKKKELSNTCFQAQVLGQLKSSSPNTHFFSQLPLDENRSLLSFSRLLPFYISAWFSNPHGNEEDFLSKKTHTASEFINIGCIDTYGSVAYIESAKNKISSFPCSITDADQNNLLSNSLNSQHNSCLSLSDNSFLSHDPDGDACFFKLTTEYHHLLSNRLSINKLDLLSVTLKYFFYNQEMPWIDKPGIVNSSSAVFGDSKIIVWRFEPCFRSWSGKFCDVFRVSNRIMCMLHSSTNFKVLELSLRMFPDNSWVEDIRLFSDTDKIYATCALFLPSSFADYSSITDNNTGAGLTVKQCIASINLDAQELIFENFLYLTNPSSLSNIPSEFEKNWSIFRSSNLNRLIYSIDPFITFKTFGDKFSYTYTLEHHFLSIGLMDSLDMIPRLSTHCIDLSSNDDFVDISLCIFHVRDKSYAYAQFILLLDKTTLKPLRWLKSPLFSRINSDIDLVSQRDLLGIRSSGVCYISSARMNGNNIELLINMFDQEVFEVSFDLFDFLRRSFLYQSAYWEDLTLSN